MNKVFSIELTQYSNGTLWTREHFDIRERNAELAIRKAKTIAKTEGSFFKTKPINVESLKLVTNDLR